MDSLIFDVDGTLWDSTEQVARSWSLHLREQGIEKELTGAVLKPLFGMLLGDIAANLFPEADAGWRQTLIEGCCEAENKYLLTHPGIVFEGVEEMLERLSGQMPLFIVSNCQAGYVESFLESTGLTPYFKDHLCPGDTGLAKAGNLIRMKERWCLKDPWYVGDTMGDFRACEEAGVPFIHAGYGFGEVPQALYRVSCPQEVIRLAEKLKSHP
ncbi:MAG: HAD family hydrolase [Blautia sp.]|nr:HAD family hydrolase [Blautia sp.]